ncbi:MAG: RNA polymerase sigma factor [Collinsella sp.]|nr:RNA polymerase sigma factor [Collinsella sp.]
MCNALERHHDMVYRFALSQMRSTDDAQDVAQEVFIKLLTETRAFKSEEHLRAWLLRVTLNRCRDLFRQVWRQRVNMQESMERVMGGVPDSDPAELVCHPVWEALSHLKEEDRAVIHLRYVEELSISETAAVIGCGDEAARTRIRRARERLRREMLEMESRHEEEGK